jgi:hypothetical protein
MAMQRIWRAHGLLKKRRRKYQRKQDLAHIKARWAHPIENSASRFFGRNDLQPNSCVRSIAGRSGSSGSTLSKKGRDLVAKGRAIRREMRGPPGSFIDRIFENGAQAEAESERTINGDLTGMRSLVPAP